MNIQITVGEKISHSDWTWNHWRWHAIEEPQEAAFPLTAIIDGKRYELASNGPFAEVEK